MRAETARILHEHRDFLHGAGQNHRLLRQASTDQICALFHLLCTVLRREIKIPEKIARAFSDLPNAEFLKKHFLDGRSFRSLLTKTATQPGFGRKILSIVGQAAKWALKAFRWLKS